jgi:hypothetical protein
MHRTRRLGLLSFVPLAAVVMFAAGPLGPPIYWFATLRTGADAR